MKRNSAIPYLIALALGLVSVVPFVMLDGRLILEPDLLASQIVFFHDAFRDWSWLSLPAPAPGSTYFDGNLIVHGLGTLIYRAIYGLFASPPPVYQSAQVTAGLVNAVASAFSICVFFATVRRLSGNAAVALLITVLFALSPQIIDIDPVRTDRLMIPALVVVLHVSVLITRGEARRRDGAYLGLAMALLSTIKFNGIFFGAFPVSAFASALLLGPSDRATRQQTGRVAGIAVLAGLPFFLLLMIRFVLHPEGFIQFLKIGYEVQMPLFLAFSSYTPRFYYNIDLFLGYGRVFLVMVLVAAVIVTSRAVTRRDPTCVWLIANLLLFSAAGVVVFKYARAGYHFVPLYLYALAIAAQVLRDFLRAHSEWRVRAALILPSLAALLIAETTVVTAFAHSANVAWRRPKSIARTRLDSRAWIAAHFQPGDRICMIVDSEWSNPHLDGLGFFVITNTFEFRPNSPADMAAYRAPQMAQVKAACDAIVFDDLHKNLMLEYFRTNGLDQRLQEWESLYRQLERDYPAKVFIAKTPAYNVSRIDVHDLRALPQNPTDADGWLAQLPRRTVLRGKLVDRTLQFGGMTVPITTGRFSGAINSAARYEGKHLLLQGWARDTPRQEPAVAIIVTIGQQIVAFDGTGTARRRDVARALNNPILELAGYISCAETSSDRSALQPVRVFAVGADGTAGEIGPETGVAVKDAPEAPLPEACRSLDMNVFW